MTKLVGTAPNQVPSNADLGSLAYLDHKNLRNLGVGRGADFDPNYNITLSRNVGGSGVLKIIGDSYYTGNAHIRFENEASAGATVKQGMLTFTGNQLKASAFKIDTSLGEDHVNGVPSMEIYHYNYPDDNTTNVPALEIAVGNSDADMKHHGVMRLRTLFTGSAYQSPQLQFQTNANNSNDKGIIGMYATGGNTPQFVIYRDLLSSSENLVDIVENPLLKINATEMELFNDVAGNEPSQEGDIRIKKAGSYNGRGGLEFHTSSAGGAGYGARIVADSGGNLWIQTRANQSSWQSRMKFESNGNISLDPVSHGVGDFVGPGRGRQKITGFMYSTNTEENHVLNPDLHNALAWSYSKGYATATVNGAAGGISDSPFAPGSQFYSYGNGTGNVVIEVIPSLTLSYGRYVGCEFGNTGWAPSSVKIEEQVAGTWHTVYDVTNAVSSTHWSQGYNSAGGPTRIRYTFSRDASYGALRLTKLFAYNYSDPGAASYFVAGNGTGLFKNLVMPSGVGIDFSATTSGAGGVTVNQGVLDDYEEGTWTPTLVDSNGVGTWSYTYRSGWYTKVGNLVTAHLNVAANVGTNPTGSLQVAGFPFVCTYESVGSFQCNDLGSTWPSNTGQYTLIIQSGQSYCTYRGTKTDGTAHDNLPAQSVSYLRSTVSYITNS